MTFRTLGFVAVLITLLLTACARDGDSGPAQATDTPPAPVATPVAAMPATGTPLPAADALSANDAWIRLLPGELPAAGYVVLRNDGDVARKLVSASSGDFAMVMLHQSMIDSGMSHMREVTGVDIPAHGTATLAPGSYHLMLMQPRHALKVGQKTTIVLHFGDGTAQTVEFDVRPANSSGG